MRLTVFNGSPRGKNSNTKRLMEHFSRGFMEQPDCQVEMAYLNRTRELENQVKMFAQAEHVILAFPLYTDAMPAIVKNFIEALEPLRGHAENPSLGFIVQSGFPEPAHSRYVERYLVKLASRLACAYYGTAIRGGVEGIRMQPDWMTKKLFKYFYQLGKCYSSDKGFDEGILLRLAPWEKLPWTRLTFLRLFNKLGPGNMYWDHQLKDNNAFEQRFARPFVEELNE